MPFARFNPCLPCCGMPLVCISTCDSSVNYAYLCTFELADGTPGNSCAPEETNCVYSPTQDDIDKWAADKELWATALTKYQKDWPAACGIIAGGYRCWATGQNAIYPLGEDWITDTYGDFEFSAGGTDEDNRLTLSNLQVMFTTLLAKHELEESERFGFLFLIDNTGSITEAQWGNGADIRGQFTSWIESTYPQCQIKEVDLNNYLVDGEDWVRHFAEYYSETAARGI